MVLGPTRIIPARVKSRCQVRGSKGEASEVSKAGLAEHPTVSKRILAPRGSCKAAVKPSRHLSGISGRPEVNIPQ